MSGQSVRVAAMDVGTNTALLSICDWKKSLEVLYEGRRVIRLGEGVDQAGAISAAAASRLYAALSDYREEILRLGANRIVIAGTSASRDASNLDSISQEVERRFGWRYELLSGLEEARLTFAGAMAFLPDLSQGVVVDVGGGSTEVVEGHVGPEPRMGSSVSMDVGSVRIAERFFSAQPPHRREREAATAFIRDALAAAHVPTCSMLIGTAGTAAILAILHQQSAPSFQARADQPWTMSRSDVASWSERLFSMSRQEVRALAPDMMLGRDDVFPSGVLVLLQVMLETGANELVVSSGGLRHGLALRAFSQV